MLPPEEIARINKVRREKDKGRPAQLPLHIDDGFPWRREETKIPTDETPRGVVIIGDDDEKPRARDYGHRGVHVYDM